MKVQRPWWDLPLLVGASLLFIICTLALFIFENVKTEGSLRWLGVGTGYVAMLLLLHFASRHIEERQLKQAIYNYRRSIEFAGHTRKLN